MTERPRSKLDTLPAGRSSLAPLVLEDSKPVDDASLVAPEELRERVIETLRTVYDPEIPLNIYDLGLVYELATDASGTVTLTMTLTARPQGAGFAGSVSARNETIGAIDSGRVPLAELASKFAWDGSVITLCECAWVKTRPSAAKRSRLGVVPRGFPSKPTAS